MKIAVNVTTDSHGDWQSAVTFAREAERLGVESIWTGESWGYDAITPWHTWRREPKASLSVRELRQTSQ